MIISCFIYHYTRRFHGLFRIAVDYKLFIGWWLKIHIAVTIGHASIQAIYPHACKLSADWLNGLGVAFACFIYEFLSSQIG